MTGELHEYWFEHSAETHTLVLSDDEQGHKPNFSEAYHTVSYYPPKHKTTEEYLHEFNLTAQMVSGAYASSDYDYTRPKADLLNQKSHTQPYPEASVGKKKNQEDKVPEIAKAAHEIYQYAADVSQPEAGPAFESNEPILEQQLRSQWNLERSLQLPVGTSRLRYGKSLLFRGSFGIYQATGNICLSRR